MKITLPNGLTLEGTQEQIVETANKLGFKLSNTEYYMSDSRGLIKISEMNTMHLRNAILKKYEAWVHDLHSIRNPQLLVETIINGVNDPNWLAMVREYAKRKEI